MAGENQFLVFCLSVLVGFVGGVLYEPFACLRLLVRADGEKRKLLGGTLDLLFCVIFAIFCVFGAFLLDFPSFRGYIGAGYLLGGIIYLKILHKVVAILEKICYNVLIKAVKPLRKGRKHSRKGRRKGYESR